MAGFPKLSSQFAWNFLALVWGLLCLTGNFAIIVFDGSIFKRASKKAVKNLETAREDLWNLASVKYGYHRFFELENGVKLHYVERCSPEDTSQPDETPRNLVIFLHGFPDSWALWKDYLELPRDAPRAWLIALDLPGYGGSDNLKSYDPDVFLETMVEFIIAMRDKYLAETHIQNKVLIVGHDWGAAIALRLAAEAHQLADRFIVSNTVLLGLARANVTDRCSSALKMTKTWLHRLSASPRTTILDLRLLSTAFRTLFPVLYQLLLSHYVFIFQLPYPLPTLYGRLGNFWFLRQVHSHASPSAPSSSPNSTSASTSASASASAFASSLGPSPKNCTTQTPAPTPVTYGASVLARARRPDGGFPEKIRLYREGLLARRWSRSLATLAALQNLEEEAAATVVMDGDGNAAGSGAVASLKEKKKKKRRRSSSAGFGGGLFEDGPEGAAKAPCTVVWGAKDVALDRRICLEGMGAYLGVRGSQMLLLPEAGHWAVTEKEGGAVVRACLLWSLQGEEDELRGRVQALEAHVKFLVDK
ncbi:MAG: hypothetical protein Q9165_002703 [Trypethelium subeluteriae]